jgi:hypothetical protein
MDICDKSQIKITYITIKYKRYTYILDFINKGKRILMFLISRRDVGMF